MAAVIAWLLLALEQVDVIHRVNAGTMPSSEVRDGYIFLGLLAIGTWLLAFRPRVVLDESGEVEIRNPLRTWRFPSSSVATVQPMTLGIGFTLNDGRTPWSIALQDTWARTEPRWYDVAEAVTGQRPDPPSEEWDEDD